MSRLTVCTFAAALVVAGSLAVPTPASAGCEGECVNIAPPGQFCRRCMDAGEFTGVACKDIGSCGCIFVQCEGLTGGSRSELTSTEPLFAPEPLMTPVGAGGACDGARLFDVPA